MKTERSCMCVCVCVLNKCCYFTFNEFNTVDAPSLQYYAIRDDTKVTNMDKSSCGRCHKVNRLSFKCAIFNAGFSVVIFAAPYGRARFLI